MIYDSNLSFCKFRIPQHSGRVIWEITNECNYACSYCIFASTGRKPQGELDTTEIYRVLNELKEAGFSHIKFTGGEPFLRDDMMDILDKSSQMNFIFDISTNASRFTSDIAQRLAHSSAEMIHISLDGHDSQTHQFVRGKKSFSPTLTGLELLLSQSSRPPVRIGCVIHQGNQNQLFEMVQFCSHLGVEELVFSLMEPVGRMKEHHPKLANLSVLEMIEQINLATQWLQAEQLSLKVSHNLQTQQSQSIQFYKTHSLKNKDNAHQALCPGGERFLFINSLGKVSPCTWVSEYVPHQFITSLKDNSLTSILQSSGFTHFNSLKPLHQGCLASADKRHVLLNSDSSFIGKI
jgi:MoaA/NifB/PqqE/SkfB family radical SAM enzyme